MRAVLLLAMLVLAGCSDASISRVDNRTFSIQSGGVPGGSDAPNRRLAERVCPKGYRVLDQVAHRGTPDRYVEEPGVYTTWTVRCL